MRHSNILFCTSLLLLIVSCQSDKKDIKNAAMGYLEAEGNYRFSEAREFATKETCDTKILFEETYMMPQMDTNAELAAYVKSNTPATITIDKISIESDTTATAEFTKVTPIQKQPGTVKLVKRDNKWLVDQSIKVPDAFKYASDTIKRPNIKPGSLQQVPLQKGKIPKKK